MERGECQLEVSVMVMDQLTGELPGLVVVNIDERREAIAGIFVGLPLFQQTRPHEVAHRLGAVLMAARLHIVVKRAHQLIINRHGCALQCTSFLRTPSHEIAARAPRHL